MKNISIFSDKRSLTKSASGSLQDRLFQRCYGVFGCFRIDGPWTSSHRPLNLFPKSADEVVPGFWLYTRRNKEQYQDLKLGYPTSVTNSNIDPTKLTFVVTHGYLEHGNKKWVQKPKLVTHVKEWWHIWLSIEFEKVSTSGLIKN